MILSWLTFPLPCLWPWQWHWYYFLRAFPVTAAADLLFVAMVFPFHRSPCMYRDSLLASVPDRSVTWRFSVDPAGRRLTFDLTVPEANLTGNYDVKGNFLGATIASRGNFFSIISEWHCVEMWWAWAVERSLSDHAQGVCLLFVCWM